VVTDWRLPVPPDVTQSIFWRAAGPLTAGGEPAAVLLAGMMVLAADEMLVNLADTPANRAFFGPAGTAGDSSPFPQLRIVAVTARAGRAMLGAILDQAGTGEQTLLKRLVRRRPGLFAGRVACSGRNFPGYDLITAIPAAGGHVIARMKEGILEQAPYLSCVVTTARHRQRETCRYPRLSPFARTPLPGRLTGSLP
jgi:hypothetical protein